MQLVFDEFVEKLALRLTQPLPGDKAHEPMRATPMGAIKPRFEFKGAPKPGSVLILLYPDEGKIKFPLTKRPDYIGAHGGQVSLPGGKMEDGETSEQTALREAEEEVGVHPAQLRVIGRLSPFFVIPSNFIVTPVVAIQGTKPSFTPDPIEVVRIIEGNIEDLIRESAIQTKEIIAARVFPMMAPHFLIEGEVVWGATAMMLNEFRSLVMEIV